jgi:hypothetical protein
MKCESIKKLNEHHSLQWISATSTISPSILMYLSHVFTNFKYSVAIVIGHLYSPSPTNSHLHLLTAVLTSPLYPLPVNFDGQKHISPINPGPNNELICGTKFPISFPLHINVFQEEELFNRRLCYLLHVTPNTSAAAYRKIKYLKNTTSQAQEPYWTRVVHNTIKSEYRKVCNVV